VEVRFSGNDSFDLNARTNLGVVDNQAAAFVKPDTHSSRHSASRYAHSLFGTVGQGLAKVELSSYSGTSRILKRHSSRGAAFLDFVADRLIRSALANKGT